MFMRRIVEYLDSYFPVELRHEGVRRILLDVFGPDRHFSPGVSREALFDLIDHFPEETQRILTEKRPKNILLLYVDLLTHASSQPLYPAKQPRTGHSEEEVVAEAEAIIRSPEFNDASIWAVLKESMPRVSVVLRHYELTHQDEKARRLRALLEANQVRAGPMRSAYGAHVVVDGVEYILIATNREEDDLARTLLNNDFSYKGVYPALGIPVPVSQRPTDNGYNNLKLEVSKKQIGKYKKDGVMFTESHYGFEETQAWDWLQEKGRIPQGRAPPQSSLVIETPDNTFGAMFVQEENRVYIQRGFLNEINVVTYGDVVFMNSIKSLRKSSGRNMVREEYAVNTGCHADENGRNSKYRVC